MTLVCKTMVQIQNIYQFFLDESSLVLFTPNTRVIRALNSNVDEFLIYKGFIHRISDVEQHFDIYYLNAYMTDYLNCRYRKMSHTLHSCDTYPCIATFIPSAMKGKTSSASRVSRNNARRIFKA